MANLVGKNLTGFLDRRLCTLAGAIRSRPKIRTVLVANSV